VGIRQGGSAAGEKKEKIEGSGGVGQIGIVAALGTVEEKNGPPPGRECLVEPQDALRRDNIIPAAGREGHRHREGLGMELGRAFAVFLRHLFLGAAVARGDCLEESLIVDEIRRAVEGADAVDEIGMEGAAELQAAFRSGTPAGIATLEELIDDHSDGMMDAASPKVQDKVCVALEVMLGLAPPARKGRAPSGRKPARFVNDMYGELPPWMTR